MSEGPVTLLACPPHPSDPQAAFDWFPRVLPGFFPKILPGFRLAVAVAAKVRSPSGVKKINIASDYTAELARINSLAAITRAHDWELIAAADSMALFALSKLIELDPETVRVAILRKKMLADPEFLAPAFATQERPFACLAQDPAVILFDKSHYAADLTLSLALDTVLSGAIYAAGDTSLVTLIEEAQRIALAAPMQDLAVAGASKVPSAFEAY